MPACNPPPSKPNRFKLVIQSPCPHPHPQMPPFYGDNEQQIFESVIKSPLDFQSDPWPKISDPAKVRIEACVRACACFCMRVCVCVCACACACAHMRCCWCGSVCLVVARLPLLLSKPRDTKPKLLHHLQHHHSPNQNQTQTKPPPINHHSP